MNKSSKRKISVNKASKGKISWTNLQKEKFLNKSSKDKSPWTHLHKRKNLLNKSSWIYLHERKNLLNKSSKGEISWKNFQRTNLHEHIFIKEKISWINLLKEKSSEQIFKGQISMNKFQKINDEKFSKDFIKINGFSFLKGVNVQIVYKTPWTFRPPIYKLPIQA